MRFVLNHRNKFSLTRQGFETFYLNRTNRSGILTAGPIGGNEQKGRWKIDARFNKKDLIERIETLGLYTDRIRLFNFYAIEFLKKQLLPSINKSDKILVYFDPPYFKNGKQLYLNYYTEKSHIALSSYLIGIKKFPWILTYDNVPEIRQLYQGHIHQEYKLNYSVQQIKRGSELLITSNNFSIPSF